MYVCMYVYISLLDSIPIGTVQRYVCTFKLNTYVFLVLGSTFNIQHACRQSTGDGRWKLLLLLQHIFFKDGLPHSTNGNTLT